MAIRDTITPELAAERARLISELQQSYARAALAIQKHDDKAWLAEESTQASIVRRIKEIDGTVGQPWDA